MGVRKQKIIENRLDLDTILEAMVTDGFIKTDLAAFIKKRKAYSRVNPISILSEFEIPDRRNPNRLVNIEDITKWVSHWSGIEYFHIDPLKIKIDQVTKVLPNAYVKRLQVLPVSIGKEEAIFVTAQPFLLDWIPEVERTIKKKIIVKMSNPQTISNCINEFYTVRNAIKHLGLDKNKEDSPEIEKMTGGSHQLKRRDEKGVSGIVDWLFQFAYDERATDIHLEPKQGVGVVRFRIDGALKVVYKFDPEVLLPVISRIKILAEMKVDEKRMPQDGRIKRTIDDGRIMEIRTSSIPTHYGEKMVLRIFDPKMADKGIDQLGLEGSDLDLWKKLVSYSYGIVLVTGPTGSGKSTTLHAALRHLAKPEVNICTVEDPIEIINDEFNQMQVHKKIDLTFANAIRAFLRQDPDIIMVGEIRDTDTSEMAIQASLTGHMVFSTLHTNDALSSITRLIDLGVPPHLLNATLKGVLAQRLVRVLCSSCKKEVDTPAHTWKSLVGDAPLKMPEKVFHPVGCQDCKNTGFKGRVSVYELVEIDDQIRSIVDKKVELLDLKKAAKGKYTPIRINGAKKVIAGVTCIEEILRVVV